jgi:hypothetical protein
MLGVLSVATIGAATARADNGVLDNALDQPATPPAEPAKPTAAKPAEAPAPPAAAVEPINPDAARSVDNTDLVKKLTGETPAAAGPDQMLDEVVTRMGDVAKRLQDQDPGPITQETQRRIVVNLDTLIEMAKKQQQQGGSSKPGPKKPGDKKEQNPGSDSGKGPHKPGGESPAQESTLPGGGSDPAQSNGQDIHEKSTEWGNLPEKDRDLIINGVKEEPLAGYREQVQRYYKALADLNRAARDGR